MPLMDGICARSSATAIRVAMSRALRTQSHFPSVGVEREPGGVAEDVRLGKIRRARILFMEVVFVGLRAHRGNARYLQLP